jgi:hypothetical protein
MKKLVVFEKAHTNIFSFKDNIIVTQNLAIGDTESQLTHNEAFEIEFEGYQLMLRLDLT